MAETCPSPAGRADELRRAALAASTTVKPAKRPVMNHVDCLMMLFLSR